MTTIDQLLRAIVRDEVDALLRDRSCPACTPPSAPDPDEYLSTTLAAAELGVSVKTLANWRTAERGPEYVRQGKLVRYRRGSLAAWLQSR